MLRRKGRAHLRHCGQAHVRLVDAVESHRLIEGHARERRRNRLTPATSNAAFRNPSTTREDRLLLRKRHLQIDLRELRLAVRAQILVAEAARYLEIPVEARDHQDLLEQLRRLRQRVELAGMHAARHQIIARALGR